MRHAKSDWDDRSVSDHDRPLNKRGLGDAPRIAKWIQSIDSVPDVILCSSATRTMQTAELMIPVWGNQPKLVTCESLYLASPETIFNLIEETLDSSSRLLVIAHNPGISSITGHLAERSIQMPTAAVAVFDGQDTESSRMQSWQFQTLMLPKALPTPDTTETDSRSL